MESERFKFLRYTLLDSFHQQNSQIFPEHDSPRGVSVLHSKRIIVFSLLLVFQRASYNTGKTHTQNGFNSLTRFLTKIIHKIVRN